MILQILRNIVILQIILFPQVTRTENRRSVSVGATGGAVLTERHSYAEGRVPAPHGLPPSPGGGVAQRRVAAACQASRRLLEETLAKPGSNFFLFYYNKTHCFSKGVTDIASKLLYIPKPF